MTANPELGETKVVIGGVEYVLAMTFNALIELQQMFRRDGVLPKLDELLKRAQNEDYEVFRAIFWVLFRRHHPEVTVEQAGDLITKAGGLATMDALLNRAVSGSAPTGEDYAALGVDPNPRKAATARRRRKTGAASTSRRVA